MNFASLCGGFFHLPSWFLWLALIAAAVETGLALWAKWLILKKGPTTPFLDKDPDPDDKWARFLEALTKLLESLKGMPAWIAIFLAGLALLWLVGEYPQLCPV